MKTIRKSIVAIALLLASSTVVLATNPKINIVNNNTFVLSISDFNEDISINIKDFNDYILYSQEVYANTDGFSKKFNFGELPDGKYFVDVEDQIKVVSLFIEVKGSIIVNSSKTGETIYKPGVLTKDKKVYINTYISNKKPLDVVIYDKKYSVVYEGEINKAGKVYSFKSGGDYIISLKNDKEYYKYEVSIK